MFNFVYDFKVTSILQIRKKILISYSGKYAIHVNGMAWQL